MSKIVIIGGGFGGVRAALDLTHKLGTAAEITLIDRKNYHLFTPALYEVASAFGLTKDRFSVSLRKTVSIPYADIFEGTRVSLVQSDVSQVSLEQKTVTTRGDAVFPYDYLILALGSQSADFNIPGVREYAFQFKTIEDALMLNHQLTMLFERASRNEIELPIRIVVGGAGFTGVELASELACVARHLRKKFRLHNGAMVTLVEAGPKILPSISDTERKRIISRLTRLGVVIIQNGSIEHIAEGMAKLTSGRSMRYDLLAWTAGVRPHGLLPSIQGLELTPAGKVVVDEHLNTPRYESVFAVGDIVEFSDHKTQRPEPALAYIAVQHGKIVATNILRSLRGKELKNHIPFYSQWVAPVGGKYAVAHLGQGLTISGFLGWMIREIVDLKYFLSILSVGKAFRLLREEIEVFVRND